MCFVCFTLWTSILLFAFSGCVGLLIGLLSRGLIVDIREWNVRYINDVLIVYLMLLFISMFTSQQKMAIHLLRYASY